MQYLLVFLFGGLGSLARLGAATWVGKHPTGFPIGTLCANVAACAVFGAVTALISRYALPDMYRFAVLTGFCGGFSTFSAFSGETISLINQGQLGLAALYVCASLVACGGILWLALWWGMALPLPKS